MYHGNIFPAVSELTPVHYAELAHLQMYRAWDGAHFTVAANNAVNNRVQLDPSHAVLDMRTNRTIDTQTTARNSSRPLQDISNHQPVPSNQFVHQQPSLQNPGAHAPSVFHGVTANPGVPQFFHPISNDLILPPGAEYSFTGFPSQFSSAQGVTVLPPPIHADTRPISFTSPAESTPTAETRYSEALPGFDTQLPFETLLSNLQELLSMDQQAKNTCKIMTPPSSRSHLAPECTSTPSDDVWSKQVRPTQPDSRSSHPAIAAVPYSKNEIASNVFVTPYPTNQILNASQYPTGWAVMPDNSSPETLLHMSSQFLPTSSQSTVNKSPHFTVPYSTESPCSTVQYSTESAHSMSARRSTGSSPDVPHSTTIPHSTEQERVAAREHCLKAKFSQLSKLSPQKVKELSTFLQIQSAQIEMYRLQQLAEASYPHYKEWVNAQCDSQLHQLMDRVEVSLQVLEIQACKENKQPERRRGKIPDKVAQVYEAWYRANANHPYPTAETCENLALTTGMKVQQVRKWFSNKRCRSKVLQKSMENGWINQ